MRTAGLYAALGLGLEVSCTSAPPAVAAAWATPVRRLTSRKEGRFVMTSLAEKLRRQPCFGTFLKLGRPEVADIAALAGFDFVVCDMEHAQIAETEARDVIRACVDADLPVVVRLPEPVQGQVNRLVEAGAVGIQMPRLRTAEEVRRLYAMLHFPPRGERSVGNANRLAGYGTVPVTDYLAESDRRTLVIGQFETRQIDEPCDPMFDQLDVAFIGPSDLSIDFGSPGNADHPHVRGRIELVEAAAARHGSVMGIATKDVPSTRRYLAAGYRYLAVAGDVALLVGAARELVAELHELRDAHVAAAPPA